MRGDIARLMRVQPGLALVDISALTGTAYYMTVRSRYLCLRPPEWIQSLLHAATGGQTSWALIPYCVWLTYATYLNAGIWWLNRGRPLPKVD